MIAHAHQRHANYCELDSTTRTNHHQVEHTRSRGLYLPLHLLESGEQVQQELRHRALRAGVDGFRRAEEANPQANQFLDAADAGLGLAAP